MTPPLYFYAFLSVMNLLISGYVLARDPHRLPNQAFAFFGGTIAFWTLAIGLAYRFQLPDPYLVRAAFATASLMLVGLLTLSHVFPSSPFPRSVFYRLVAGTGVSFFFVAFTPLLVEQAVYGPHNIQVQYGPLHSFFALYVYTNLTFCLLILIGKFRSATGYVKLQFRYLLLGLLLPGLGVTITNLLIPLVFHNSRFGRYGPAFTLVFLVFTAHALIRHRLMNIRLVISRSVAYLLAVLFSGSMFALLLGAASTTFAYRLQDLPWWLEVGLIFPIALLFPPIRHLFQKALDRYLYREPYDYERTIRQVSRTIAGTLDLPSLLKYLAEVIGQTLRPEHVAIYMRQASGSDYHLLAHQRLLQVTDAVDSRAIAADSRLITALQQGRTHLLRDDALRESMDGKPEPLLTELDQFRAHCIQPILDDGQLSGLLLLGPKLSADPYFTEDLDLLATLVSQASIAIKNANLYRQVLVVNEHVESILATMESGVAAVAADGNVTLFNAAAARITGLNQREIRNQSLEFLPSAIADTLRATLHDGQPRHEAEALIEHSAGGSTTPVLCSTSVLTDRSGTILGAVAVFSDLTRLKQLEGEKHRAERLASIGALASGVAHEIKNPLVAIKTFAELLPERFTEEDFRNDFAQVVIREIDRIDDLVARLRGLARPSAQPLVPLDLRDPVNETLSLLRAQLEQSQITVQLTVEPTSPIVAGDAAQLKQLFINLFVNAIEAMTSGGRLSISMHHSGPLASRKLVVEVSDTGPGIPDGMLDSIFDPFVTTKPRGSGLGLSISRGIADSHRATIRARNNTNASGSTITVEFPVPVTSTVATHSELQR
jgi:PAS domain S-box-containing protein